MENKHVRITEQDLTRGRILLIDKPLEWTSFDVVNKIRSVLRKRFNRKKIKVGHGGTLDPLATGLLIIGIGPATKILQTIQNARKTYEGTLRLGARTPSYDAETEPSETFPYEHLTESDILRVAKTFTGKQRQLPPPFSAVRHRGKKLYEYARKGEIPDDIKPREVEIFSFDILAVKLPEVHFRTEVSKGTYIRTLADDFGKKLDNGAYLTSLRRTAIGELHLKNAVSLDQWLRENI